MPRRAYYARRGSKLAQFQPMSSLITQFSRLRKFVLLRVAPVLAWVSVTFSHRADTHIYGGALSTNQNGKLVFSNGPLFDATRTNFALPQVLRTNGLNA